MTESSIRRKQPVDAAIKTLAATGPRGGLTHRAVDQRAGLAEGSWSYHFTIWQVLLRAAADRLAEVDIADATTLPLTGTASAEKPR
ncbi:hypothetical protein ACIOHC_42050 [Streptomyces sp. NPDC088252]|uniref:hypothetical protein n=1 Tax=Streptomyces sp. NPDC088252 TaxID=3365845 RepID=UPI00382241B5